MMQKCNGEKGDVSIFFLLLYKISFKMKHPFLPSLFADVDVVETGNVGVGVGVVCAERKQTCIHECSHKLTSHQREENKK